MQTNIDKIKKLIMRVKMGNRTGLGLVIEKRDNALEIEMIDGKKYGLVIRELNPKGGIDNE